MRNFKIVRALIIHISIIGASLARADGTVLQESFNFEKREKKKKPLAEIKRRPTAHHGNNQVQSQTSRARETQQRMHIESTN